METMATQLPATRFIFVKKLFKLARVALAIEPVLVNVLAILLGAGLLCLLHHPGWFPNLGKYYHYLIHLTYGLILLQTIKSATRTLFIPIVALVLAFCGFCLLSFVPDWQWFTLDTCKKLMLMGAVGIGTSVLVMK